jgi:hypothetical protein
VAAVSPRVHYTTGGGPAEIALIALSSRRLPDPLPVSRRVHGMPDDGDGPGAIALVARDRAEDPTWFVEQVVGPFADLIAADLGASVAATALAASTSRDRAARGPDDLGHVRPRGRSRSACAEAPRSWSTSTRRARISAAT